MTNILCNWQFFKSFKFLITNDFEPKLEIFLECILAGNTKLGVGGVLFIIRRLRVPYLSPIRSTDNTLRSVLTLTCLFRCVGNMTNSTSLLLI